MNHDKPSYLTLEFWLSTAAIIIGVLMSSGVLGDGSDVMKILGVVSSILATLGYTGARTMQKNSAAHLQASLAAIAASKDVKPANP